MASYCHAFSIVLLLILLSGSKILTAQSFTFCTNCTGTTGNCAYPNIDANPDINSTCANLDIVFILDESGSIAGYEGDVEAGVIPFFYALNIADPNVAIIEFGPLATLLINDQDGNSTLINTAVYVQLNHKRHKVFNV